MPTTSKIYSTRTGLFSLLDKLVAKKYWAWGGHLVRLPAEHLIYHWVQYRDLAWWRVQQSKPRGLRHFDWDANLSRWEQCLVTYSEWGTDWKSKARYRFDWQRGFETFWENLQVVKKRKRDSRQDLGEMGKKDSDGEGPDPVAIAPVGALARPPRQQVPQSSKTCQARRQRSVASTSSSSAKLHPKILQTLPESTRLIDLAQVDGRQAGPRHAHARYGAHSGRLGRKALAGQSGVAQSSSSASRAHNLLTHTQATSTRLSRHAKALEHDAPQGMEDAAPAATAASAAAEHASSTSSLQTAAAAAAPDGGRPSLRDQRWRRPWPLSGPSGQDEAATRATAAAAAAAAAVPISEALATAHGGAGSSRTTSAGQRQRKGKRQKQEHGQEQASLAATSSSSPAGISNCASTPASAPSSCRRYGVASSMGIHATTTAATATADTSAAYAIPTHGLPAHDVHAAATTAATAVAHTQLGHGGATSSSSLNDAHAGHAHASLRQQQQQQHQQEAGMMSQAQSRRIHEFSSAQASSRSHSTSSSSSSSSTSTSS